MSRSIDFYIIDNISNVRGNEEMKLKTHQFKHGGTKRKKL